MMEQPDFDPSQFNSGEFRPADGVPMSTLDTPIPEGVPDPILYRVILMPVELPTEIKLSSGLIIAKHQQTIDRESWNNMLARVVKLGPLCFTHPRFAAMGMTEPPIRIGDLVLITARVPLRFQFKGVTMFVTSDDQIFARVADEMTVTEGAFGFGR